MSLPWDELQPEEPELPYIPPDPAPELPRSEPGPGPKPLPERPPWMGGLEVEPEPRPKPELPPIEMPPSDIPREAIEAALESLWPEIRAKAIGYAKDSWEGIREGQTVDVLHPTITAETAAGKELVIADAKSRSWRTLIQGLIFDIFAAIIAAVAFLSGADPFVKETWIAFGVLLMKSVVSAVISYFMRLKIQPTIKTPGERMAIMPLPRRMEEEQEA